MERPELKLVVPAAGPRGRAAAAAYGAALLAVGIVATLAGAGSARQEFDPAAFAEEAIGAHLATGDPLDAAIRTLRARLTRQPLDAEVRAVYAGLLREAAIDPDDLAASRFHAARAAAIAPVTVPVVAAAATTLARAQEPDAAATLARAMFAYAPRDAAALLARLEPFVGEERTEAALPETPSAWLAWGRRLRADGRGEEAELRIDAAWRRWPDHPEILVARAEIPFWRDDVASLARILPAGTPIPDVPEAPWLFAYRARVRAGEGDPAGALADAARAAALAPAARGVLEAAAVAAAAAGDDGAAASYLRRALYSLPRGAPDASRLGLLVRLARLADRSGSGAEALRAWRAVLGIAPGHPEATRRVEALTGPLDR